MKLNTPNRLTLVRIILTPIFLIIFTNPAMKNHYLIALIIYVIASFTDFLDGYIARKRGIVTNFGKFTDPLADKMLTTSAFIGLMEMGYCNLWVLFLILFREFGVSSIRLVASSQGVVIPANMWGKVKTAFMMVSTPVLMLLISLKEDFSLISSSFPLHTVAGVLLWTCAILTMISGVTYVKEGAKVIDFSK